MLREEPLMAFVCSATWIAKPGEEETVRDAWQPILTEKVIGFTMLIFEFGYVR